MGSVKVAYASIDENGKARGGKAGDQTSRETIVKDWYNFKQTVVFRWKNRKNAKKYAKMIYILCTDYNVGYDQNDRTSSFNAFKKVDWDITKVSKTTPLETDCSEITGVAINLTMGKEIIPSYVYTGNLETLLMSTGLFKKLTGSKYCLSSDYLMEGDIINNPGHHVVSSINDGPKAGIKSDISKVAEPTLKKGSTGSEVKKLQSNLNDLKITDASSKSLKLDGEFGVCTREAVKKFQKKYGLLVDGIYGKNSASKMKSLIK